MSFVGLSKIQTRRAALLTAAFVFLTAGLLRLWGIGFGLPYLLHPDEPTNMNVYLGMLRAQDWNPHFFNYPSLFFYLNALAALGYYAAGQWAGVFHNLVDLALPRMNGLGVGITALPGLFLVGRLLSALAGLLALYGVYRIGKARGGYGLGFLGMIFLAVSPIAVRNNHFIAPDSFLMLFVVLAMGGGVAILKRGTTWDYAWAGAAAGLAISCKYTGGLVLAPLILAHFLRQGWRGWKDGRIFLVVFLAGAAFLASSPFALLDGQQFLHDVQQEARHYATGHIGMEGNALSWYLNLLWGEDGLLAIFGVAGLVFGLLRRDAWSFLLGSFVVLYFGVVSSYPVRNDRTILVILPFLYLLGADFLAWIWHKINLLAGRPLIAFGLAELVLIACLAVPFKNALALDAALEQADSRTSAVGWIEQNIPKGASIAFESYAPYLNPGDYRLTSVGFLVNHPLSWYLDQRIDYVILSQGAFRRFTASPGQYPREAALYQSMRQKMTLFKRFDEGGYEILIYKVE